MGKLLVICGPTGVGKTSLGVGLAKKFGGEILSADSRQVYRGMDIVTGKDLSESSKFTLEESRSVQSSKLGYWETPEGVGLWLTNLVEPTKEFSVAQWRKEAQKVLDKVWQQHKLPILAGGTGFYIKALVDGIETIDVPPNKKLRAMLVGKDVEELYDMLGQLDSARAASMNRSDRRNPRRLVRAIEIAVWKTENRRQKTEDEGRKQKTDMLMLGLGAPREALYKRIDERVEKRLKEGALEEVEALLKNGVSWDTQSMLGLGYRQLRPYFEGKASLQDAVTAWKVAEHQYARQQLTWFKRDQRIEWFDISLRGWEKKVEKKVETWYHSK